MEVCSPCVGLVSLIISVKQDLGRFLVWGRNWINLYETPETSPFFRIVITRTNWTSIHPQLTEIFRLSIFLPLVVYLHGHTVLFFGGRSKYHTSEGPVTRRTRDPLIFTTNKSYQLQILFFVWRWLMNTINLYKILGKPLFSKTRTSHITHVKNF